MKLPGKTVHSPDTGLVQVSRDDVEEIQTLNRCLDQVLDHRMLDPGPGADNFVQSGKDQTYLDAASRDTV